MPVLPDNSPWPIPPWDDAMKAWRVNDAWYSGDVDSLQALYGAPAAGATHIRNGQPYQGGIVGRMSSTFWGKPIRAGEQRKRLHIPAASDIATLSSDLLLAEPPTIALPDDAAPVEGGANGTARGKAQDRLDDIMGSDHARAQLAEGGEYAAAFGATALTLAWDKATMDRVWVQSHAADVTVPEFRHGQLVALNLWSEYRDGSATYYRHVERHEAGAIFHTLYQGTNDSLGRVVPLQDRPETAGYAELVNADGLIPTGIPYLTAAWWVNMPARAWRKRGQLAEAGRSDYTGGTLGLFDALDEAWSSWMRDLDLGKARLVVPQAYLDSNGRGRGAVFDTDREVFQGLDIPGQAGAQADITQVQFAIRVAEHEQTTQALLRRILASAGYGELDKESAQAQQARTATEVVVASQSRERTRDKKALYARQAFAQISRAALLLDSVQFPGKGGGDFGVPTVTFPAASQQDPEKTARTVAQLRAAQAMSIQVAVQSAHPDWDDQQVSEEVAAIQAERGIADPTTVGNPVTDPQAAADQAAQDQAVLDRLGIPAQ